MAHESSTFGTYHPTQAAGAVAVNAGDYDYGRTTDAEFEDDLPPIAPGWWIIPSVLCGGSMIASAVMLF